MAHQAKFKTYDVRTGKDNLKLKAIARQVLNSELPIQYKIGLRDEILAMKEKERLGFNFNRSLTASLRSRWDVVENTTLSFLQEIVEMNDQIEDDSKKNERQLLSLIFTRSTNISLEARVEQMGSLLMRMNFYKKILEERIRQFDPCRNFLLQCCEMMGYLQPGQLLDRYAALNHVFKELYKEYDDRMIKMNKLQEKLQEIKCETDHRNMLLHNEMSNLHMKLKELNTKITYLEYELNEKMDQSTNTEMEIYSVKNSIHRSYVALMNYRGLEPTETNQFLQLEHIMTRVINAQDVIKFIRDETMKQHMNFRRRHGKEREGDTVKSESVSSDSMETLSELNDNRSLPLDAVPSAINFNRSNLMKIKELLKTAPLYEATPPEPIVTMVTSQLTLPFSNPKKSERNPTAGNLSLKDKLPPINRARFKTTQSFLPHKDASEMECPSKMEAKHFQHQLKFGLNRTSSKISDTKSEPVKAHVRIGSDLSSIDMTIVNRASDLEIATQKNWIKRNSLQNDSLITRPKQAGTNLN